MNDNHIDHLFKKLGQEEPSFQQKIQWKNAIQKKNKKYYRISIPLMVSQLVAATIVGVMLSYYYFQFQSSPEKQIENSLNYATYERTHDNLD